MDLAKVFYVIFTVCVINYTDLFDLDNIYRMKEALLYLIAGMSTLSSLACYELIYRETIYAFVYFNILVFVILILMMTLYFSS